MPYIYKSGLQFGINETNIYGGASYVELTQAEYDALSDTEKHNGQIYFITDGNYDFLIVNDSVPVGSIQAYGGISAPDNWLICDGSAVSRTEYAELFQAIGITYGVGDGSTTFNLPDLRGKVAIGQSTAYELGASGGEKTHLHSTGNHTLTLNEIPSHAHRYQRPVLMWGSGGNVAWPSSGTTAKGSDQWGYSGTANAGEGGAHNHGNTGSTSNMQPYLVTNYIIKVKNPSITSGQQLQAMELFYPVGSYYETSDLTFDPNVEWGGTWVSKTIENNDIISGTPTFTGSHSGNWSSLTKVGKMVEFRLMANFNMSLAAGTNTPIGSVPEGFRPISEVIVGGCIVGSTYGFIFIEPDGTIMLQRVAAGTSNLVRQNIVYFTSQNEVEKICWHRTA